VILGENPDPLIEIFCPPKFPVGGETEKMVGTAVNSKYYLGFKEALLKKKPF
jgi:hypothetical protein